VQLACALSNPVQTKQRRGLRRIGRWFSTRNVDNCAADRAADLQLRTYSYRNELFTP
jgi:hypothetical protein